MADPKSKGPLLTSDVRGGESDTLREIPAEFRAAMEMQVTEQEVPTDVTPDALSDTVIASKTEQTRTNEKKKRTVTKPAGPVTLVEKDTNAKKQVVTRTRTMQESGTTATVPTATKDVQQKNLGIGQTVEEVSEVPSLFTEPRYAKEIPDVVPAEFRVAIPTTTTEVDSIGTASAPSLGAGELSREEVQKDSFVKRVMVRARAALSLPISLVSYRTSRDKQLETVTTTLKTFGSPTNPTATKDVSVKNLGDGTMLEEVADSGTVFAASTFSREVPDIVPEEFRVAVPVQETSADSAGTAADPTMGSGDLKREERQLDAFVKKVTRRFRSLLGLPVALTSSSTNQKKQVVTITRTLKTAGSDAAPSATKDVDVKNLGDGTVLQTEQDVDSVFGAAEYAKQVSETLPERFRASIPAVTERHTAAGTAGAPTLGSGDIAASERQVDSFVKETSVTNRSLESTPTLHGQQYEPDFDIAIPFIESIVEDGTSVSHGTVEPIGGGNAVAREVDITAVQAALEAYVMSAPCTLNIGVYDVLTDVQVLWETANMDGDASESGTVTTFGTSWSFTLPSTNSSEGSAVVMPEIAPKITRYDLRNVNGVEYFFFVRRGNDVAAKLASLASGVTAFPSLQPQSATVILRGQKVSLRADSAARVSASAGSSGSSAVATQGGGNTRDISSTVRAVTIPPTLHATIDVSDSNTSTVNVASSAAVGSYASDSHSDSQDATGHIDSYIDATTPDSMPSGTFYRDISVSPFKYDYSLVRAKVFTL